MAAAGRVPRGEEPSLHASLRPWRGSSLGVPSRAGASPAPLTRSASPSRNLEQEISFDFGPDGEFAYLYSQCYELATNECVPTGRRVGERGAGEAWEGGSCAGSQWSWRYL